MLGVTELPLSSPTAEIVAPEAMPHAIVWLAVRLEGISHLSATVLTVPLGTTKAVSKVKVLLPSELGLTAVLFSLVLPS